MMEQCGASEGSEWGMQRMLELKWHKDKKTGKKHLCSWTDREHKAVEEFERKRKAGELGTPIVFKSVKELRKWLDDK